MKAAYAKDTKNETIFVILANLYSGLGQNAELDALLNDKITSDPYQFLCMGTQRPDLDEPQLYVEKPNRDRCCR